MFVYVALSLTRSLQFLPLSFFFFHFVSLISFSRFLYNSPFDYCCLRVFRCHLLSNLELNKTIHRFEAREKEKLSKSNFYDKVVVCVCALFSTRTTTTQNEKEQRKNASTCSNLVGRRLILKQFARVQSQLDS